MYDNKHRVSLCRSCVGYSLRKLFIQKPLDAFIRKTGWFLKIHVFFHGFGVSPFKHVLAQSLPIDILNSNKFSNIFLCRTISDPPQAVDVFLLSGRKFSQCSYNWWDHSIALGITMHCIHHNICICLSHRRADLLTMGNQSLHRSEKSQDLFWWSKTDFVEYL